MSPDCRFPRTRPALLALGLLLTTGGGSGSQAQTKRWVAATADVQYNPPPCSEAPAFWPQGGAGEPQTSQGPQDAPVDAAAAPAVEKTRKLSRTFAVPAGKPYTLATRYGRVQVNVWNRNEIRTDVDIITRADTEEKARQLQDMIQVQLLENDPATGGVSARSRFGAMPRACWSRTKLYEVNYTVWVPQNTPLHVFNTFGDVSISGELTGPTELTVAYGTLRTGRLEGRRNVVRVGNGQVAVAYARRASIDASYSRLRLDEGQTVDLRNHYSDIAIGQVQELTVHSKYGDVALGTVRQLRGTSGFCKFSIDQLSDRLEMTVQHCPTFEVRNTGRNFSLIDLDGGYSTIVLNFADEAGFNFDVNTQHGKLLVDKRLVRVAAEETGPTSSDVQGTFGAKARQGSSSVNIKVRYGNVSFNR
jgi:hypothetical protein